MRLNSRYVFFLKFLLLSAFVLGACTSVGETGTLLEPPDLSTQASVKSPIPVLSPEPTQADPPGTSAELQEEVLAACPAEGQAEALREGHEPDWEALPLSACYELDLDLSQVPSEYSGSARVTFANQTGQALDDLVFRLYPNAERIYGGELRVSSARIDETPVEAEVILSDRTALRLSLAHPLPPGEVAVVELEFSGQVPVDREGQGGVYGTFNYDSAGEVLVLANGYPILATWEEDGWRADPVVGIGDAVVSEAALYRVHVTPPPAWQMVTTGIQVSNTAAGGASLAFISGPVREFILVGSPNFVEDQAQVDGVQVRHWGLPGGEDRWEAGLEAAVDSLTLFDERFGAYPYRELDVVAVPLWLAAGVEYPGLILLRQGLYLSSSGSSLGLEYVVAHEVAHQWWYGVVGNDVLEHPWQDEALASFSSLLYQEEYQPLAYAGTLGFYQGRVAELEAREDETGVDQPVEAFRDQPGDYSPVVYIKGALFFEALREQLGEDTFFQALQAYYTQHAYGLPPPKALLDAFEQACSCSLEAVYQEWGVK